MNTTCAVIYITCLAFASGIVIGYTHAPERPKDMCWVCEKKPISKSHSRHCDGCYEIDLHKYREMVMVLRRDDAK